MSYKARSAAAPWSPFQGSRTGGRADPGATALLTTKVVAYGTVGALAVISAAAAVFAPPLIALGSAAAFVWLVARPPLWASVALVPLTIPLGAVAQVPVGGGHFVLTFADCAIGLAVVSAVIKSRTLAGPLLLPTLLWVLWSAAGTLLAGQVGPAMSGFKVVLAAAIVILLTQVAVKDQPEAARRLVLTVSAASVIVSAMVLLAVSRNPGTFANSAGAKEQADLSFGGSNYLAALVVFGLTATAVGFLVTRGLARRLLLLGVPLQLLAVVATGSRGQTAALGVLWLAVLWISMRSSSRAAMFTIGGLLVSGGIALYALGDWVVKIWQPALSGGARNYSTAQARFDIWATAIETFRANPIIGVGLRNFEWAGDFAYAHNWWLQLLAETGLVGLVLFVVVVLRARAIASKASRPLLDLVLVVAAASGSLEPTILTRDYDYLFWIVVVALANGAITPPEQRGSSPASTVGRRRQSAVRRPIPAGFSQ